VVSLLDANALIALAVIDHEHHAAMSQWWGTGRPIASCTITQGALVRYSLRLGAEPQGAITVLDRVVGDAHHEFWADDVPFDASVLAGVRGHRQVTDVHLAALAERRGGVLVTFDRGIAELRPRTVEMLTA